MLILRLNILEEYFITGLLAWLATLLFLTAPSLSHHLFIRGRVRLDEDNWSHLPGCHMSGEREGQIGGRAQVLGGPRFP